MKVNYYLQALFVIYSILIVKGNSLKIDHNELVPTFSQNSKTCSSNKEWWVKKGFEESSLPEKSYIDDSHLKKCTGFNNEGTCCNEEMEGKIEDLNSKKMNSLWRNTLRRMEKEWKYYLKNFQRMFIEEINNSYNDLHDMYDRTYGDLYLSNSAIFSQFYKKLSDHLDLSRITKPLHKLQKPEDTVDRFFEELMWKIINLFPDQKISSSNYNNRLEICVKKHMNDARTFEDTPLKVRNDIQKSFSAAQKFLSTLNHGKLVLNALFKVKLEENCKLDIMKLMFCQQCSITTALLPCHSTCVNVLSSCLSHVQQVNSRWNSYIKSLSETYDLVKSPISSLATTMGPLSIAISEAIMHFQENPEEIVPRLEKMCGIRIMKRSIHEHHKEITSKIKHELRKKRYLHKLEKKKRKVRRVKWLDDKESVVNHFEKEALTSTDFIANMPQNFCSFVPIETSPCWNITTATRDDMRSDKQREKEIERAIHRLSYYSENHERKHGRGKKKRPKFLTTTTTTTTTKDPVHDTYNEENDEYREEDDEDEDYDYYASGEYYEEELEDELHGGGDLMETERSNSFDKFPNFDNTHRSYDRFNKFNQQSTFNLNNNQFNNADNSFNEQLAPNYPHKHFSHDFNKHPNVQAPSFNSHNKKYSPFNKEVDDTKFYKQYMGKVTKPPFIRPYSSAINHVPYSHLVLFFIVSSIYAISFHL